MKCSLGCNIQRVLVYKQNTFVLKMIIGCNPSMIDFHTLGLHCVEGVGKDLGHGT